MCVFYSCLNWSKILILASFIRIAWRQAINYRAVTVFVTVSFLKAIASYKSLLLTTHPKAQFMNAAVTVNDLLCEAYSYSPTRHAYHNVRLVEQWELKHNFSALDGLYLFRTVVSIRPKETLRMWYQTFIYGHIQLYQDISLSTVVHHPSRRTAQILPHLDPYHTYKWSVLSML